VISTKPYFLRAIREWALDNNLTPQLLVDTSHENVSVPDAYINDSQILLNISDQAVNGLVLGNEEIVFSARFNGSPWQISVPIAAVMAVFTREDGQGIFFESSNTIVSSGVKRDTRPTPRGLARPLNPGTAQGVESDNDNASGSNSDSDGTDSKSSPNPKATKAADAADDKDDDPNSDKTKPGRRGRPNLRLVD